MADTKRYKVTTIGNMMFSGKRHGIQFYKGYGEGHLTKDQVDEFQVWGYEVTEIPEETPEKDVKKETKGSESKTNKSTKARKEEMQSPNKTKK